jgi:MscS family membrane protein
MNDLLELSNNRYILALVVFLFFQLFRVFFRKIILKIVNKTKTTLDDEIIKLIHKPIEYIFILIGLNISLNILELNDIIHTISLHTINSGFIIVVFWALLKILNYLSANIYKISNKFGDKISNDIANFIVKTIRFFTLIIGFILVVQEWGYNVSGFLASLGLVGMAFALAAKDTASNLFGSLVIFTDKPFKVGDWIKTPQVEGTIESIGIRSTKIRTFAQAVVTVPNGTLANSAILNWSRMGKRRIKFDIGLVYDTKAGDIQNIVDDIKTMLKNHKDIDQETIHIYFSAFEASSLNIFCYYFTKTTDWGLFMKVREDTYFKIMKIVEQNNSSFAYPTQTIKLDKEVL